jgi:hypothetical protein
MAPSDSLSEAKPPDRRNGPTRGTLTLPRELHRAITHTMFNLPFRAGRRTYPKLVAAVALSIITGTAQPAPPRYDYRVLATSRTGTMEKEMNEAADAGYLFAGMMGGQTSLGGKEVLVVMKKDATAIKPAHRKYKLLATSRTGTMQKELQQAGDEGFVYCGVTVFESAFGGHEVSVILERDPESTGSRVEFKVLATSRTSTMQKELQQVGNEGFSFLGVAIGKTKFGGAEVVSILQRPAK